jgi:hypothetical protein
VLPSALSTALSSGSGKLDLKATSQGIIGWRCTNLLQKVQLYVSRLSILFTRPMDFYYGP